MKNKIILITLALILISTISAFGISSPYWEDNPLVMEKGETKVVNLNIQNMVGNEDITIRAEVIQGEEIISLKQDTFLIKAGTSDTIIPLEITIPKDIEDNNQTIKIDFKKVIQGGEGIPLGTGMSISFDIIANESPKKNYFLIILIGVILLLIIIYLAIKKNKK